ncbi:RpiB/LacA/LacB family sugar-phosphate isomerase [Patescibacteria group bacterium]|jgi:ribose 5-phosphate isomerase B|nr:RpiB/LacA/LacB family sugar-phosphate isomerase [Patescibacteria group bacterium]
MTVYFACDHAGFHLKEALVPFVRDELHLTVHDCGAHEYVEGDDYPDYCALAAQAVSEAPGDTRGIILGGSGQGEAIVANRFPHVRAVVFNGQYAPSDGREVPHEVETAREHNDANILSLGARFLNEEEAKSAVHTFLTTFFSGDERHRRRIKKIEHYP